MNVDEYKKFGFTIIKNLFHPQEIEQIRQDAKKLFKVQLKHRGFHCWNELDFEQSLYSFFQEDRDCFLNCGKHIQHLISLHKLSLDDRILKNLKLLGVSFPNICTRPVLYFNSKHLATKDIYHTTPAHQDWFSMQGSQDATVVWIPLVKMTKNLGALEVVPKSHKNGLFVSKVEESFGLVDHFRNEEFKPVELEAGDALFFSAFLVHRSGQNVTDSIRWSCHFRYNNMEDSDFIGRKFPHPYVYKPIMGTL